MWGSGSACAAGENRTLSVTTTVGSQDQYAHVGLFVASLCVCVACRPTAIASPMCHEAVQAFRLPASPFCRFEGVVFVSLGRLSSCSCGPDCPRIRTNGLPLSGSAGAVWPRPPPPWLKNLTAGPSREATLTRPMGTEAVRHQRSTLADRVRRVVGHVHRCGVERDPFGGPVAMRLGVGGSWSTVERTRPG